MSLRQPSDSVTLPVGRAGAVAGLFLYAVEEVPRSDYASYDDWLRAVTRFFKRLARLKP